MKKNFWKTDQKASQWKAERLNGDRDQEGTSSCIKREFFKKLLIDA